MSAAERSGHHYRQCGTNDTLQSLCHIRSFALTSLLQSKTFPKLTFFVDLQWQISAQRAKRTPLPWIRRLLNYTIFAAKSRGFS